MKQKTFSQRVAAIEAEGKIEQPTEEKDEGIRNILWILLLIVLAVFIIIAVNLFPSVR